MSYFGEITVMKMAYRESLLYRLLQYIERTPVRVFVRKDFEGLGSYRQVSRALKKLVEKKQLVKIGSGLYARAYSSRYIDEPLLEGGFDEIAREALDRMGVKWEPGSAEQDYNQGQAQQIPMHNTVKLKSRLRRQIQYHGRQIYFEGKTNAR